MSETNGTTSVAEKSAAAEVKQPEPMAKKPKLDDSVEDRDFDEETQKALEEIDANQNEIDALNERKQFSCRINIMDFDFLSLSFTQRPAKRS